MIFKNVIPAQAGTQLRRRVAGTTRTRWVPAFAGMTLIVLASAAASAQDKKPPYWASIASGKAMIRTGPGRNYPGTWLYQRRDLPVRVVKIYTNWRMIEDPDGVRGWMLVTLLSDRRTAMVKPGEPRALHEKADRASRAAYLAEPGVVGRIEQCDGDWCKFIVGQRSGWIGQGDIYGVAANERVD